jgi:hypothetical protein
MQLSILDAFFLYRRIRNSYFTVQLLVQFVLYFKWKRSINFVKKKYKNFEKKINKHSSYSSAKFKKKTLGHYYIVHTEQFWSLSNSHIMLGKKFLSNVLISIPLIIILYICYISLLEFYDLLNYETMSPLLVNTLYQSL